MRFLMFPHGFQGAIVTDDYSPFEIAQNLHILHFREDVKRYEFKYPCLVYTDDTRLYCTLYTDKVIFE